jgi:hypothetical protein
MKVCHHYRISHSEFLRWDEYDQQKAIAQLVRERTTCPHCSTRPEEWDESRGGHRRAYYAIERKCLGCKELQQKRDSISTPDRGSHIVLVPNERR